MTTVKTLLVLILLLVYPVLYADEDKSGIPFRVAALEEITLLQQEQLDTLSGWAIVAHPDSAPSIVMGDVISFTRDTRWVVVEVDIAGEIVLLWVNSNQFIRSNSTLFFPEPGCSGQAHASIPNEWFKQIHIVVDLGDSVVPYKSIGDPVGGPWQSRVFWFEGSGICDDGEFGNAAEPVQPIGGNLYEIYPRAPEPWSLEKQ